MKIKDIDRAVEECHRFLRVADLAKHRMGGDGKTGYYCYGTKETSALRRASMDLSRELTILRR